MMMRKWPKSWQSKKNWLRLNLEIARTAHRPHHHRYPSHHHHVSHHHDHHDHEHLVSHHYHHPPHHRQPLSFQQPWNEDPPTPTWLPKPRYQHEQQHHCHHQGQHQHLHNHHHHPNGQLLSRLTLESRCRRLRGRDSQQYSRH